MTYEQTALGTLTFTSLAESAEFTTTAPFTISGELSGRNRESGELR